MKSAIIKSLTESKAVIGWVHGIGATLGAVILAYLVATLYSTVMMGDYAQRIIPSMMLTPILVSVFGIWLLFSKSLFQLLLKIFGVSGLLSVAMIIQMNGLISWIN